MCYNYIRYNEIAVKSGFIAVFSDFSGGRFKLKKLSRYIKILALALSAVLTLCACSGDGASSGESSSAPDYSLDTSAKVGYVYNEEISRDNMTYMFEKSRKDIETALGLETCYVDGVAVSQFRHRTFLQTRRSAMPKRIRTYIYSATAARHRSRTSQRSDRSCISLRSSAER